METYGNSIFPYKSIRPFVGGKFAFMSFSNLISCVVVSFCVENIQMVSVLAINRKSKYIIDLPVNNFQETE